VLDAGALRRDRLDRLRPFQLARGHNTTRLTIVARPEPDRRHIDADDVGAAAAYLLSDEADNVTGTTLYVDSGYHAMGM
jgi:enoyl-[acyl-carrier-protein] reductase (NADH)